MMRVRGPVGRWRGWGSRSGGFWGGLELIGTGSERGQKWERRGILVMLTPHCIHDILVHCIEKSTA